MTDQDLHHPAPQVTLVEAMSMVKTSCAAPLCGGPIDRGEPTMVDKLSDATYCFNCGVNLRFHRKRAIGRGEKPPVTFQDVEARFKQ